MRLICAVLLMLAALVAQATDINLVAIMGNKVMVSINGGKNVTVSIGQKAGDATLVSVAPGAATFDVAGKKTVLTMDNHQLRSIGDSGEHKVIQLTAAEGGHFYAELTLNGYAVRGIVDTGATTLAISSSLAKSANITYSKTPAGMAQTAQGRVPYYKASVNTLRFGEVMLYNVEVGIMEGNYPAMPLIGMNIINRFSMQRDNDHMTLTQRY